MQKGGHPPEDLQKRGSDDDDDSRPSDNEDRGRRDPDHGDPDQKDQNYVLDDDVDGCDREQGHLEAEGDEDDWKQDIQLSKKDLDLLRRRQRQDVIASKVAGYVWDQEVKNIF